MAVIAVAVVVMVVAVIVIVSVVVAVVVAVVLVMLSSGSGSDSNVGRVVVAVLLLLLVLVVVVVVVLLPILQDVGLRCCWKATPQLRSTVTGKCKIGMDTYVFQYLRYCYLFVDVVVTGLEALNRTTICSRASS